MEKIAEQEEYIELARQYDSTFMKKQTERLKEPDKDMTIATYACIQNISNLMKKLSKQ